MKDLLYIVLPAYNEEENIEMVVAQWHQIVDKLSNGSRLMIVNDGSKDGTYSKLTELKAKYPLLIPINKKNSGHGATCLFAYREAIKADAEYIFQTDSDGQTDSEEFWQFWENRTGFDFIVGSRAGRQDGFSRVVVTRVLRLVVWLILGEWVTDANTPFRLMKTERLIKILKVIPEDFFLSNVVISAIAVKWKERCLWLPITFKPRQGGVNSINLKRIINIGWKALGDFRDLKRSL